MNHSDQACLDRSHERTVTLRRGETLLSFEDYSSGDGLLLVLGNLLLYREFSVLVLYCVV